QLKSVDRNTGQPGATGCPAESGIKSQIVTVKHLRKMIMFEPMSSAVAAGRAPLDRSARMRTLLAALLLSVIASCSALAADPDIFVAQSLSPEGKVILSRPLQFDGVGSCELMVLT